MKNFIKTFVKYFLGKTFAQSFFKFLYLLSLKGMNFGGGVTPLESGEEFVVNYAIKKINQKEPIIFDVGGNNGEYTELWLRCVNGLPAHYSFYIFEPSAVAFSKLTEKFKKNNFVKIIQVAVSDKIGQATLYSDFWGSGLGSLSNRGLGHVGISLDKKEEVQTISLDYFTEQEKISHIDFLKLDIEGFEYAALMGVKKMLDSGKIRFIQFEFGGTDIDTRIFFKDFYLFLENKYNIYRVLKNGLKKIEKYSELEEIFLTTNYLAELK